MRHEPSARESLRREEAILRAVRHDAIPRLLDAGEDDQGPYLVQTALPGVPLRALVDELVRRQGRVPLATLRALALTAFETLAAIHAMEDERGRLELVHGDLGPDHVIVGPARAGQRGRIGFVDFGQARARGIVGRPAERGTLPYVAPEVVRTERAPDQGSDVFALAATIAYAALGRDPCRESEASARLVESAERGLDLAALEAVEGLAELGEILRRALAFEREARLSSAAEILSRLKAEGGEGDEGD
jgi:serine/threonine protein kinase